MKMESHESMRSVPDMFDQNWQEFVTYRLKSWHEKNKLKLKRQIISGFANIPIAASNKYINPKAKMSPYMLLHTGFPISVTTYVHFLFLNAN